MNTKSKALRLADWLEGDVQWPSFVPQEAADELRRLHEIEQKYEQALQEGMQDCVERWGGYRTIQVRGADYDSYLARKAAKWARDVELVSRMKDRPTLAEAEAKLKEGSYELRVLRAAIEAAHGIKENPSPKG